MSGQFYQQRFHFMESDGREIELRGTGDQHFAHFETLDGYSVVLHKENGFYVYVRLNPQGNRLIPTELRPGIDDPALLGLTRESSSQIRWLKDWPLSPAARCKGDAAGSAGPANV